MKRKRRQQAKTPSQPIEAMSFDGDKAQRRLERVFIALLAALGVYLSIVYFGQKAVPNSDFTAFVQTGEDVLHFRMPSSFKRVPVLGILQIAAGALMFDSPHPTLTGGLVVNSVLYILSIVLFYKLARLFLSPTCSFCLCVIAALNPLTLLMLVDPIAETAIVFFILLTLYLICIRSRWCYLAAMAASMTRYECFGLIGIAFLFDLFGGTTKREKLIAAGAALAAAVPMAMWLIGTKMTTTSPQGHYFKHFLDVEGRNGFKLLSMLWQTSFGSLLHRPEWISALFVEGPTSQAAAEAIQSRHHAFQTVWACVTAAFFVLGAVWAFVRKQWRSAGGLLLFWLGYVSIHMSQNVLIDRYTLPVVWLTLLTATYGLVCSVGRLSCRIPKGILYGASIVGAVAALIWTMRLWPAVPKTAAVSTASATAVYAGLVTAAIGLGAKQFLYRRTFPLTDVCLFLAVSLPVVSNQFTLSMRLGQGDLDIEFRRLAEWHREHADEGERLVTTLPGVVNLFLPEGRKNAVHLSWIPGSHLGEFAEHCRAQNIRYLAWDSRLGLAVNTEYYNSWGMAKIHPLGRGQSIGPFTFITKIEANPRRFIYVYRLDY